MSQAPRRLGLPIVVASLAHRGPFELADAGTLFPDEIGDLPRRT